MNRPLVCHCEFTEAANVYAQQKRFREASGELLQLAQIAPNWEERSKALFQAAPLQFAAGDSRGAHASLDTLAQGNAGNARALLSIGDMYWKVMGDTTRALAMYRRAISLRPDRAVASALQERLGSLENPRVGQQ